MHHHPIPHRRLTGRHQLGNPLHFHQTNPARSRDRKTRMVTIRRDRMICILTSLQDHLPILALNQFPIDGDLGHKAGDGNENRVGVPAPSPALRLQSQEAGLPLRASLGPRNVSAGPRNLFHCFHRPLHVHVTSLQHTAVSREREDCLLQQSCN